MKSLINYGKSIVVYSRPGQLCEFYRHDYWKQNITISDYIRFWRNAACFSIINNLKKKVYLLHFYSLLHEFVIWILVCYLS